MNVTCNRAALCEAAQLASSIVPARTPKPILQCAKLFASDEGNKLTVEATDGEINVRCILPQVEVASAGTAVIPADRITAILRESQDDTISLEVKESTCEVKGKDSRFHIYGHDPDDFPELSELGDDKPLIIQAATLRRMVHLTAFSTARENTRYAINGVLWEQHGKKLRMVATDGRRLAMIDGKILEADTDSEASAIVPLKFMQIIERIIGDPEEKIEVTLSSNHIILRTAVVELSGTLVQGRFPKYADVVPTGCDKKAQLGCEVLRSAVRRVALLTNEQSKGIEMAFETDEVCLSSYAPEAGDAEIRMPVKYDGTPLKIGFNPVYLLEMLRVIDEPELVCEFSESAKPALIRAGKDFLYVLMPVTV